MIDESMDTEALKSLLSLGVPVETAWQRLIVMVGGVTMNCYLGIAIYSFSLLHTNKIFIE